MVTSLAVDASETGCTSTLSCAPVTLTTVFATALALAIVAVTITWTRYLTFGANVTFRKMIL